MFQDFYEWLGQHTGVDHENIDNIWEIADTVFIEVPYHVFLMNLWGIDAFSGGNFVKLVIFASLLKMSLL